MRKMAVISCMCLFIMATLAPKQLSAQEPTEDYTSKVPRYTFSTTLEEQEAELKSNPLMLRLKASREKLASDIYRPFYHYVNPEGNLNDPNGLCFWKGNWHLFYQAYPPEDPRQHWGHAISKDLVHWRDLPYAIYPHPEYQCFSGATYVEEERVIAMYLGTRVGEMVAVSDDPLLLNWEKVSGQAVIPVKGPNGELPPYHVGDPCIWKKDGVYYSLSGGRKSEGPGGDPIRAHFLFRSENLVHWEYMHLFVEDDLYTRVWDDGACPYFWPIGDRYILPFFSHTSGGQYLLGDYDKARDKFVVTNHGLFNFGAAWPAGIHAPSATPDGDGGVIIIFNMNAGKPTEGWDQIMTLPRRLTLLSENKVGMEPAGDLTTLRYDHQHIDAMALPANEELVLESIHGNTMEIIAEIDPMDSPMVELNVLRSPDRREYTRIAFFGHRGNRDWQYYSGWEYKKRMEARYSMISIESSFSSILPDVLSRAPETASFFLEPDEPLKLRVFIDKSVVEVFVNGKQCVAMRVYPGLEESVGVSLRSQGQDCRLESLDAWQMKNIYE